jgi:hypothetical protein
MTTAKEKEPPEPRGFGQHTRGLSGEYAHEQGWGIDVEERTRLAPGPNDTDGGTDYDYGARDFGDEPVNTASPDHTAGLSEEAARNALGVQPAKAQPARVQPGKER